MPVFGKASRERLETCHLDIQNVMNAVIEKYDITIVCGYRNEEDQEKAYRDKLSQVRFPDSKHNTFPSLAVDVAPYITADGEIPWEDGEAFAKMAGYILATADSMGVSLRWGGDWDGDNRTDDEKFRDRPHFEIIQGF